MTQIGLATVASGRVTAVPLTTHAVCHPELLQVFRFIMLSHQLGN